MFWVVDKDTHKDRYVCWGVDEEKVGNEEQEGDGDVQLLGTNPWTYTHTPCIMLKVDMLYHKPALMYIHPIMIR